MNLLLSNTDAMFTLSYPDRKTSCEPKVVHAKYGEVAVVNCTLNSEKDFDSSEVEWTKLWDTTLPAETQKNIGWFEIFILLHILLIVCLAFNVVVIHTRE